MDIQTLINNLIDTNLDVKNEYWKLYYRLKKLDTMFAIPILAIPSLITIVCVTQLIVPNLAVQVVAISIAIMNTIVASAYNYYGYQRRSTVAQQVAKRWESLIYYLNYVKSNIQLVDQKSLSLILHAVFTEMDAIGTVIEDTPQTTKSLQLKQLATRVALGDKSIATRGL